MSRDSCVAIPRGAMGLSAVVILVFPDHTLVLFPIYIYIIILRCHILIKRVLHSIGVGTGGQQGPAPPPIIL